MAPPPPVLLDAARLHVFREVVRRGSLSAAADALSFTQPAVSRQIAALEREAGAQLLERTPRGIRLTEAGRVLLGHAEAILAGRRAARAQVESVAGLAAGRLRIGAFQTANATVVPRAIATFARTYPRVELSLVEAITPAGIAHPRAGAVAGGDRTPARRRRRRGRRDPRPRARDRRARDRRPRRRRAARRAARGPPARAPAAAAPARPARGDVDRERKRGPDAAQRRARAGLRAA